MKKINKNRQISHREFHNFIVPDDLRPCLVPSGGGTRHRLLLHHTVMVQSHRSDNSHCCCRNVDNGSLLVFDLPCTIVLFLAYRSGGSAAAAAVVEVMCHSSG